MTSPSVPHPTDLYRPLTINGATTHIDRCPNWEYTFAFPMPLPIMRQLPMEANAFVEVTVRLDEDPHANSFQMRADLDGWVILRMTRGQWRVHRRGKWPIEYRPDRSQDD